jgi:hypothetical protein
MSDKDKKETVEFALPEGRVINCSLFQKDIYTDERGVEGTPQYKIEMAFDPDDLTGEDTIEDEMIEAACEMWGDHMEDVILGDTDEDWVDGRKDGDKMAKRREQKGKEGDAYKGKLVIRANTIYNKDGFDGPGGIQVFDENVEEVEAVKQGTIYPGCYGIISVVINCYNDARSGDPAIGFYLGAFQKTRDGDKLFSAKDRSELFKPVGRPKDGKKKRRSRKG